MELAQQFRADAPVKVHLDWADHWQTTFDDHALQRTIFQNPRMTRRIIEDLSGGEVDPDSTETAVRDLTNRLAPYVKPETLHDIGLGWCAPRLFRCLFNSETRDACGVLSPAQVDILREFRDHASPKVVPVLPQKDQVAAEGNLCVMAWLIIQDTAEAKALILRISPDELLEVDQPDARAAFFDAYLAFCEKQDD